MACFSLLLLLTAGSCNKFVQIAPPKTQIVTASVFSNDATAKSAMDGIYSDLYSNFGFAGGNATGMSVIGGLLADEFTNYSTGPDQSNFFTNALDPTNYIVNDAYWLVAYQSIYYSNSVLEGLNGNTAVSAQTKNELSGEAKFVRAFCHFYLVNLFGDVPLITTTDYRSNATAARTASALVYQQIVDDLKDAQSLLADDYSFSGGERVRPNKWAATALLSRVYLYRQQWANAASNASLVIASPLYQLSADLNNVFKKNNTEAIWQLMPVSQGDNTDEGNNFILTATPSLIAISPSLLSSFETGDARKLNWVGSIAIGTSTFYYPFKYKVKGNGQPLTEYSMVLRLAEQYLVRAEANAQLGKLTESLADLNVIRTRAGLPLATVSAKEDILTTIVHERQVELFSEWGHRWLDLKRTSMATAVLGPIKAPNWQPTDTLFPIPLKEIKTNGNLVQNQGY